MSERTHWLTPAEAADHLGVYPHELRALVRDKGMPGPSFRQGGRRPRYDMAALDAWMRGADAPAHGVPPHDQPEDLAALALRPRASKGIARHPPQPRGRAA